MDTDLAVPAQRSGIENTRAHVASIGLEKGSSWKMQQKNRDVVASIQALRAIAVIFVVLNHFFPRAVPGGYIGVDIFFVVSGFLISSHLLKELKSGDLNFNRFYLRRARRLLPASLLVLTLTALSAYLLLPLAWHFTPSLRATSWHASRNLLFRNLAQFST
jgi:peptidoglycan/LPS O-acetylase OafA/YrhL